MSIIVSADALTPEFTPRFLVGFVLLDLYFYMFYIHVL